jgi:hypothetical protein
MQQQWESFSKEHGNICKAVQPRAMQGQPPLCRASTSWLHLSKKDVDGRDKPGHDEKRIIFKLLGRA